MIKTEKINITQKNNFQSISQKKFCNIITEIFIKTKFKKTIYLIISQKFGLKSTWFKLIEGIKTNVIVFLSINSYQVF